MPEDDKQRIRQMNAAHIEKIRRQLADIQRSFLAIKKSGMSRDILIAWLKDRTEFGKNDLRAILEAQDEFYQKLVKLTEA